MKKIYALMLGLISSSLIFAQTTQTVPVTGTVTVTIPAPVPGPAGPAGPTGPVGPQGPAGVSPTAAQVAASPGFAAAVAALLAPTSTCSAAPASTTATVACPSGYTGSWSQVTTYTSAAAPACWTPVLSPTSAPSGACTPVVNPPPSSGTIVIVDGNGQLGPQFGGSPTPSDVLYGTPGNASTALIGGNWNSNYTQTLGATAPDGTLAMQLTPKGTWSIWLPHGYAKAGNSTPNGIETQLAGESFFEMSVYVSQPAAAGVFTLGLYENLGLGSYVGPNAPTNEQAGPVTYNCPALVVGWNNLKVPLSALGLPWTTAPASTDPYGIYKLAMQQHLSSGQTIWIKNAQFVSATTAKKKLKFKH